MSKLIKLEQIENGSEIKKAINTNLIGIKTIDYNHVLNQMTIEFTDGNKQVFEKVGNNSYGGFNSTILWEGNVIGIKSEDSYGGVENIITLSDDIDNYDLIHIHGDIFGVFYDVFAPPYNNKILIAEYRSPTKNRSAFIKKVGANGYSMIWVAGGWESGTNTGNITKIVGIKGNTEIATIEDIQAVVNGTNIS